MHVVYPPTFCITIVFDFPCDDCNTQEELIGNNGFAKFWGQNKIVVERFHSRGQHLCKCIGTKESVCIRKVQIPQNCLGTPTWPPCYCCGTPIWPP